MPHSDVTPSEPLRGEAPCRLCEERRVTPYKRWNGQRWVGSSGGLLDPTGAFCEAHELLFRGVRHALYADMRIGQAVEAFCLASGKQAP